jgi:IS30 family transposase
MRRSKKSTRKGQARGQIIGAVSIRERPAEANERAELGHWEGDLISGSSNTHIATLVDRVSRATMLVRLRSKDAATVRVSLARVLGRLPEQLRGSLTWDRGPELAEHAELSRVTGIPVYFCDPQSPWQRGTNENTNGLLRQYFPKGTPLSGVSQATLNACARRLNRRPRKVLGFKSPNDILAGVALTL